MSHWNQFKSNLPKQGEGEDHLMAKKLASEFVFRQTGLSYRFEYPIKIGDYVHTFDSVFWKTDAKISYVDNYGRYNNGYSRDMDLKNIMEYTNDELIRSKFKHLVDEQIRIVIEIDDYQQHTHTEQLINDGEAEAAAKKVFAKPLTFLRFKKEEIVTEKLETTESAEQYMNAIWVSGNSGRVWDWS